MSKFCIFKPAYEKKAKNKFCTSNSSNNNTAKAIPITSVSTGNKSHNNDNNTKNNSTNARSNNSTTKNGTNVASNDVVNENELDNNNAIDKTIRTHVDNNGTIEKSSHSARVTGHLAQGCPPSPNDINLNVWNNWNNNANNNKTQHNVWAINSVSRCYEHNSAAGVG